MSEFAATLQGFIDGSRGKDDILAAVDRAVDGGAGDPLILLTSLYQSDEQSPLPRTVRDAVELRILRWIHKSADGPSDTTDWPMTVVMDQSMTGAPAAAGKPRGSSSDAARTRARQAMRVGPAPGHTLLGRFRLIERIGIGGMSIVYKAVDLRRVEGGVHDPHVAVKVLTLPLKDYSESLSMLQQEAHKLQQVAHPSIVRVIDCDRDGKTVFMTMEYLDGRSLDRIFRAPGFRGVAPAEADRIVGAIATALSAAHTAGLVHGDLKPGNIMLTATGEVKLIDFGIAQAIDPNRGRMGLEGITPRYASPEMLDRAPPDPRDDLFALASIAFELLSGTRPFKGITSQQAREAGAQVERPAGMSPRHFAAITHGLALQRDARTPSAERFRREFQPRARRTAPWLAIAASAAFIILAAASYLFIAGREDSKRTAPATAVAHQEFTAGVVFRDCPTCPLMMPIAAGGFEQGTPASEPGALPAELPSHHVKLPAMFSIGVNEVSVGEYREYQSELLGAQPRVPADGVDTSGGCDAYDGAWALRTDVDWSNPGFPQTAAHPVTCVSWRDAQAYARWLSARTGHRYRLPSASEWEYATRAGASGAAPWSDSAQACGSANAADSAAARRYPGWKALTCSDGNVYTAAVGSYAPNSFGLHDTLGNVFEWVQDCWQSDYAGAPIDGSAHQEAECGERELRGGSWFTTPGFVRFAYRNRFEDSYRSTTTGFRLVRELWP